VHKIVYADASISEMNLT